MKNPERERKILEILDQALDVSSGKLNAFLDRACGGDASLRSEVLAYWKAHHKDPHYLESPEQLWPSDLLAEEYEQAAKLELRPGQLLAHFEIVEHIDKGGMGEVYKAHDLSLGREVALKLLQPHFKDSADVLSLFKQEGRTVASLKHPNIVTIYEMVEEGGLLFLVLEFLEGESLRHSIGKLKIPRAVEIAREVAAALNALHQKGIIHCDIKPENIMLCKDDTGVIMVKVLDFGLAILRQQALLEASRSDLPDNQRQRNRAGTPKYKSPEQVQGDELDARTDIYSLGIVLYEMVTGHRPYDSPKMNEAPTIIDDNPAPLSQYQKEVPEKLQCIINTALQRQKKDRYQTAKAFQDDLDELKKTLERRNQTTRIRHLEEAISRSPFSPDNQIQVADPAELMKSWPPVSVPATIKTSQIPNPMPFDIGTICGLDRSSFINIIAGSREGGVFENLIHVEQCLRRAMLNNRSLAVTPPERFWIRVDPANYLIPGDKEELLSIVGYQHDSQTFAPPSVVPGIFIKLDVTKPEEREALIASTQSWCDALVKHIFPNQQLAIVVHVIADDPEKLAAKVSDKLKRVSGAIPLDAFSISDGVISDGGGQTPSEGTTEEGVDWLAAEVRKDSVPPGSYFCSLIHMILSDREKGSRLRKERERYTQATDLYQSLLAQGSVNDKPTDAYMVVTDLEGLPSLPKGFDSQFLQLIHDYLPGHFQRLLREYAGSRRMEARRAAQVFAIDNGLLERLREEEPSSAFFFGASELDARRGLSLLDAHADVPGSILDREAQSLLRRYRKDRASEVKGLIESLLETGNLNTPSKAVCELFLGRTDLKDFIRFNGKEAYTIALRAGYDFDFSLNEIEELDINHSSLWALIAALPVSERRVAVLLSMGKPHRAVFGLITVEEWHSIRLDSLLHEKVQTARQERPLYFGS